MNIKHFIIKIKWFPSDLFNKTILNVRGFKVGKNLLTYGMMFIRGTGNITIGNDVTITSCRETNPIGGDTKTILFAKQKGCIQIGNYVGISNSAIVALNSIIVEDDVMIGGGCKLYDHDFHSINFTERMMNPDPGVKSSPIHIKQGAFIGAHSIILKGVTIGKKSVVGAGSVVTHSIPDGEIWAGNPAKFIRKLEI